MRRRSSRMACRSADAIVKRRDGVAQFLRKKIQSRPHFDGDAAFALGNEVRVVPLAIRGRFGVELFQQHRGRRALELLGQRPLPKHTQVQNIG